MAFLYIDDILNLVGDEKMLGIPKINDMEEGLVNQCTCFFGLCS